MVKSKYLRVKCECGDEQNIFGNAAEVVKCRMCDKVLAEPTGGRVIVHAKILKVI